MEDPEPPSHDDSGMDVDSQVDDDDDDGEENRK